MVVRTVRIALLAAALSACEGPDMEAPGFEPVSSAAPAEWQILGGVVLNEQPSIGSAAFETRDAIDPTLFDRLADEAAGRVAMRAVNIAEQTEYRVTIDAEQLAEISLGVMDAGLHLG